MAMEQTWRWFGPKDPITLKEVRQTGATGIVTALHQVPSGEVWTPDEIRTRKSMIQAEGMNWSVVESVPVHEHIKRREGDYSRLIENFKATIRNLGAEGVDTVCYNFMPVLDWSRTSLESAFADGSVMTKFEMPVFAAFDMFILRRPNAEGDYTQEQVLAAKHWYERAYEGTRKSLTDTVLLGVPGSEETYTLDEFRAAISLYAEIGDEALRENLYAFLKEVIPVAQESGVFLAIHPDDPPWPLLGLPRVVSNRRDVERILAVADVPENGLTLCTGSLGAGPANDLVDMAQRFASRISFVHLRNVRKSDDGGFLEENHLEGDVDIYGVMTAILREQKRRAETGREDRRMPMRPDHGHLTQADKTLAEFRKQKTYPGYSLVGRMRGLAELRGMELGIRRSLGL
jgi:mannonate dehydratase